MLFKKFFKVTASTDFLFGVGYNLCGDKMRIIYIDILLFLNFYITYFLISGTSCILHRKITLSRRIIGSLWGAISSLFILLPELPLYINLAVKIIISSIIVLLSMGYGRIGTFLKNSFLFFIINCAHAGIMMAIWLFNAPLGMVYNNGTAYFDLPLWCIILSTAAAYIIIRVIRYFMDSKPDLDKKYTIEISTDNGKVILNALPDSGNKVADFLTGLPVIFCNTSSCTKILPNKIEKLLNNEITDTIKGIRIIPCRTVSGDTTAVCFKPDKIIIRFENNSKETDALIGFTKNGLGNDEYEAVFNPDLL